MWRASRRCRSFPPPEACYRQRGGTPQQLRRPSFTDYAALAATAAGVGVTRKGPGNQLASRLAVPLPWPKMYVMSLRYPKDEATAEPGP